MFILRARRTFKCVYAQLRTLTGTLNSYIPYEKLEIQIGFITWMKLRNSYIFLLLRSYKILKLNFCLCVFVVLRLKMPVMYISHVMGKWKRTKVFSSDTLSTANRIRSVLENKTFVLDEKPGTNIFSFGTVKKLNLKECGFIFVWQLFASAQLRREHSEVLPFNLAQSAKRIFFSTSRFLKNSR